MIRRLKRNMLMITLLGYLLLCVVLGGAGREGHFAHGVLQAIAAIGSAALVLTWPARRRLSPVKVPLAILCALVAIAGLQLVPLPPAIWQSFPGRAIIVDGFGSLDIPITAMPTSLNVEATLSTIGYVLTPLFVILLSARLGLSRLKIVLPWSLSVAGVAMVVLGLCQVFLGIDDLLYFYQSTNLGSPVGTFANVNHFASLLLIFAPFTILLLNALDRDFADPNERMAAGLALSGVIFLLGVGIAAAGSLAVYALSLPIVILAAIASQREERKSGNLWLRIGVASVLVIAVAAVATSPLLEGLGEADLSDNHLSRLNIWAMTFDAIKAHWPVGTGMGTFSSVIPLYEDPDSTTSTFVARAHNEYLQIILEAGLLGLGLIAGSLYWLGRRAWLIWTQFPRGSTNALEKTAMVAILAILLHSIVDFPLRTPAIASIFALLVAVVAMRNPRAETPISTHEPDSKRLVL